MKRSHILFLAVALAVIGIGARQVYSITRYPQPDNVTCYGDPKPFACVYIPGLVTATIGPRLTPTQTAIAATSTPSPTATETKLPSRTPSPTATSPVATPGATATAFPPLLLNGDFEADWASTWTRFDLWPELPNFNNERGDPRSRHGGAQSLRIYNEYRCWLAGVYQTVPVQQFSTVRFSAWARTWPTTGFDFDLPPDLSVTDGVAVGIDNSGGVDPTSSGIVWVEAANTENWRQVSVQTVALSNRVTVFIRVRLGVAGVNNCQWPLPVLMGFVDDASLVIVP